MVNLLDKYYAAPNRVQDGVLFILLEAAIYLAISFMDLIERRTVANFSTELSFALEILIIVLIVLCDLGILYQMKIAWVGSVIMSIFLMVIGCLFMLDIIKLTLVLSGLFYFVFGAITFVELMRHSFRKYCGITDQ